MRRNIAPMSDDPQDHLLASRTSVGEALMEIGLCCFTKLSPKTGLLEGDLIELTATSHGVAKQ